MDTLLSFLDLYGIWVAVALAVSIMITGALTEIAVAAREGRLNRIHPRLVHSGYREMIRALECRNLETESDGVSLYLDVLIRMEATARLELNHLSWIERYQARKHRIIDSHGFPDFGMESVDRQMAYELHDELMSRGIDLPDREDCWLERQCRDLSDQRLLATQRMSLSDNNVVVAEELIYP